VVAIYTGDANKHKDDITPKPSFKEVVDRVDRGVSASSRPTVRLVTPGGDDA
jgi:hypothetical protein